MTDNIIDVDVVPTPATPTVIEPPAIFGDTDPVGRLEKAASLVAWMVKNASGPRFLANIEGKIYPRVEFWTTAGAALGLFPVEVRCERREDGSNSYAYEAYVEVRDASGRVVTAAGGLCRSDERWHDEYAVRSMAVTRATAKAYRIGLSCLAVMSGVEATPAEEMPRDGNAGSPRSNSRPVQKGTGAAAGTLRPTSSAGASLSAEGTASFTITGSSERTSKADATKPWRKVTVTCHGGERFSTFKADFQALLADAEKRSVPVQITWRQGEYGYDITDLAYEVTGQPEPEMPEAAPEAVSEVIPGKILEVEAMRQITDRTGTHSLWSVETSAGRMGILDDAELATRAEILVGSDHSVDLEWKPHCGSKHLVAFESKPTPPTAKEIPATELPF